MGIGSLQKHLSVAKHCCVVASEGNASSMTDSGWALFITQEIRVEV